MEAVEHALALASGEAMAAIEQKRQFFDAEQVQKDAFYSQAISEHIKKREEAAAVDEGNYLAAQPVRCSTGYIETSHLELRMGEAEENIRGDLLADQGSRHQRDGAWGSPEWRRVSAGDYGGT